MKRSVLAWVSVACVGLGAVGCAGDQEVAPRDVGDDYGDEGGAGGADSGTGGTIDPGPEVCPEATGVYEVEPAQSNLLFLLDQSGSMHLRVDDVDTRWTLTTAGLSEILHTLPDQSVAGLQMFPAGDAPVSCCTVTAGNYIDCSACAAGELPGPEARCDEATYQPLTVGMAPLLDPQVDTIMSAVSASDTAFFWGTPLAPALGGAIDGVSALAMKGVTSIVLLTDGLPTSCHTDSDPNANDIQLALDAAAHGALLGLRTYVVGIDGEAASTDPATDLAVNLSAVAQAGGTARYAGCEQATDCAYLVNTDNFEQALSDALFEIALDATTCSFALPVVEGGMADLDAVNVTIAVGGQSHVIARDQAHQSGWDYLPGNENVQLYGDACELLKSDASAKVEVVVGCQTEEL